MFDIDKENSFPLSVVAINNGIILNQQLFSRNNGIRLVSVLQPFQFLISVKRYDFLDRCRETEPISGLFRLICNESHKSSNNYKKKANFVNIPNGMIVKQIILEHLLILIQVMTAPQ